MTLPSELRNLDVDLPASPRVLVELLALMQDGEVPLAAVAQLIESDMALASAVVRTVNSAMFGLLRRVQTVGEAVRYLGTDEVVAITYESALRAAFPPTPALDAVWSHASRAGLLMGRSAQALGLDALQAHTAGLFARCGQAVLLVKVAQPYAALLAAARGDRQALVQAEQKTFGINHAALGSALCAAWGLAPDVVKYVREHVRPPGQWAELQTPVRRLLGLGAVVEALLADASVSVADVAAAVSPGSGCGPADLVAAVQPSWRRLQAVDA